MDTCVIFCAGGFDSLAEPIGQGDLILAADGGLCHVQKLGITPHVILGDFDSLGYVPRDATVFPTQKDETDCLLAVQYGLERGYRRFVIYGGADGDRLDHTVANFQTLQYLADRDAKGYLIGHKSIATVVKNGCMQFPPEAKGYLSVFCMGAVARGVSLQGLAYTLDRGVLTAGFPLGVSNRFTGKQAMVSVEDGSVLLIYERENAITGA